MATINASQDYDIIQTLTFASASGTCKIRLYRDSSSAYTGTVKIRAGTSGAWSDLSVSGTSTTFNVTSTTMQIAHDWNKSGNNYMTCSFYGQSTNLTEIDISQKEVLSGAIGNYFMNRYAQGCSTLTSLDVPDISNITSVGNYFMRYYASGCSTLTSLSVPDTSDITSVGNYFMRYYASGCSTLTTLVLPSVGWFATNDVDWSIPAGRLNSLKGEVINGSDLAGWRALTTSTSPNTLYLNYIRNTADVYSSNVSTTIAESIGFQISLEYDKEEAVVKTVAITNSIGQQYTSTQAKSIPKTLSSSIGDKFSYTCKAEEAHYKTISNSIGYQSSLSLASTRSNTITNSIGFNEALEKCFQKYITLSSSIGFNYRIRNVYPYIASEDFYLTKDENNTSVSGEANNFNLVGQKNNFNLVGTRNINNLIGERSKYDI